MDTSKLTSWSLLGVVFLLPIFFLPPTLVPFPLAKTLLAFVAILIGIGTLIIRTLGSGRITLPWHWFLLATVLIPLVYFVSGAISGAPLALFGYGFEIGTFASILIGVLLILFIILGVQSVSEDGRLLAAFFVSGTIISLFGLLKVITKGALWNSGLLAGAMGNTVGAWTDLAVFCGVMVIIAVALLHMLELKRAYKVAAYVVLVIDLVLLWAANFTIAWVLLLGLSLVLVTYFSTADKRFDEPGQPRYRVSLPASIVFIVSLLFILNPHVPGTQSTFRSYLSDKLNIQNLDVRPSLASTMAVSGKVLNAHALLGSGPNTFSEDWLLYKPTDLNATPFWNTGFPFGIGFVPTQIASVGVIGTLVWLGFLVYLLVLLSRIFVIQVGGRERFILIATGSAALFLWSALMIYVPSSSIFYLAFIFTGLFVAGLLHTGAITTRTFVFSSRPLFNFLTVLLVAFIGIGLVSVLLVVSERVSSIYYYNQALAMAGKTGSAVDDIEAKINKAISLSRQDLYYRSLSDLNLARAQAIVNGQTADSDKSQAFQTSISAAIAASRNAIDIRPVYSNWVALGSIYEALVPKPLAVAGAYESANDAYTKAQALDPFSPEIPLLKARLEYDHGNVAGARDNIQKALALKQDYADAYFLLTQIEVDQNDVTKAIAAAQTAAILSPNNAGIFFELGLLEYTNHDFTTAAQAFSKALQIVPDYANAKYFLGLSLDNLGQKQAALGVFQDLQKSNPENTDLPVIITNLEAGRDALYQAPSGSHPEKKPNPPISSSKN